MGPGSKTRRGIVSPKGLTDGGTRTQNFYLTYIHFSISEESPRLCKVFSPHIPVQDTIIFHGDPTSHTIPHGPHIKTWGVLTSQPPRIDAMIPAKPSSARLPRAQRHPPQHPRFLLFLVSLANG